MTTQTEALKLALDRAAPTSKGYVIVPDDAFQVIKEALAQPAVAGQHKQEPVAYTNGIDVILAKHWTADYQPEGWEPLGYTTPPAAQPEPVQEPVAWINAKGDMTYLHGPYNSDDRPLIYGDIPAPAAQPAYNPAEIEIMMDMMEASPAPVQEPVAHTAVFHCPNCEYPHRQVTHITGVAQPPWSPQRTWVGLTDEELQDVWPFVFRPHELRNKAIYQAIEAKLKEKNT